MQFSVIHVAVAAIIDDQGRVLLARRPDHVHQGGLWEFPGGKLEPGESVTEALGRELQEELGIIPASQRPLLSIRHDYADSSVLLDVWRVDAFTWMDEVDATTGSRDIGREGQALRWVAIQDLPGIDFPAANHAIVNALRLPASYLITPDPGSDQEYYLQQLERVLQSGIKLARFRAWQLDGPAYLDLACQVVALCHHYQARCLLSCDDAETAATIISMTAADGLHVSSHQLMALSRRPLGRQLWMAASCHNQDEIEQACRVGADFITLSPLKPTHSHPHVRAMGWEQFRALAEQASMPVYVLGGVNEQDIEVCWWHGGQGIAAIRSLWERTNNI